MSVMPQVHKVNNISQQVEQGQEVPALFRPLTLRGITLRNRIGARQCANILQLMALPQTGTS